jgi:hypothetical protein
MSRSQQRTQMDTRTIARNNALSEMKAEIVRLNGSEEKCRCMRRQRAMFLCDCGEDRHNGNCLNTKCDYYYTSTIVKCDKHCDKWMLSAYAQE